MKKIISINNGYMIWLSVRTEKIFSGVIAVSAAGMGQHGTIICMTEKNSPYSLRYAMTPCQFAKLYFHYFLFIPLIRMVGKLMRDVPAIQIFHEALCFSFIYLFI